jgi:hypothetical protein
MDAVIPWPRLVRLIEPHCPKAGQGRQPLGLEKMLRIYVLQQWFQPVLAKTCDSYRNDWRKHWGQVR